MRSSDVALLSLSPPRLFCGVCEISYSALVSPHPLLQAVIRGIVNSLLLFDLLITRHLLTSLEDIR